MCTFCCQQTHAVKTGSEESSKKAFLDRWLLYVAMFTTRHLVLLSSITQSDKRGRWRQLPCQLHYVFSFGCIWKLKIDWVLIDFRMSSINFHEFPRLTGLMIVFPFKTSSSPKGEGWSLFYDYMRDEWKKKNMVL